MGESLELVPPLGVDYVVVRLVVVLGVLYNELELGLVLRFAEEGLEKGF